MAETAIERLKKSNSLWEFMQGTIAAHAESVAFENYHNTLTFRDLGRYSKALAAYLQSEMQVGKGTKVALMAPNCLAHPCATLAIFRCGAVQVSVNPMYTPSELKHQLNDSDAEILLIHSGSIPSFAPIRDQVGIRKVLVIHHGDCGQAPLPSPEVPDDFGDFVLLSDALQAGASLPLKPVEVTRDDLALLQYTGGTTGPSKGAMLSHGNLLANLAQFHEALKSCTVEGEEIIVTALPMYHMFALTANFLFYTGFGGKNILISNPRDMDQFIGAIRNARFTRMNGVNTLYAGMMLHPDFPKVDFSALKLALGGGTATLEVVSDKWKALTGKPILEAYGLSETSPLLTVSNPEWREFSGTIGPAVADTDIRILDEEDRELPDGQPGEMVCRGPQVTEGYYKQPEANQKAFTKDGYFRTGDIAIRDEQGRFKIVDRKKDMVIVSGFNVFPNEVEQVASRCEGVQECACIGIPDEQTGEAVKLFVVRSPGTEVSAEQIIAFCRKHLTAYKVPKQVAFINEVPKSAVGKMLRRELRGK